MVTCKDACYNCTQVLAKAFEKLIELLSQGNAEQQERVLAGLIERLNQNGFETQPPVSPPWFDPSVVREIR